MKKLLYTLAGLSALALFASCNKEAERAASPEGEVVTATFTVAAPEGVATKAISDGTTATELIVAVYDETGKYLDELSTHVAKTGAAPTWNVSMKVIKDMTYQFVFLAKKEAAVDDGFCHFDAANAKISIDYSAVPANSDAADFFFVQDKFKVENSFSKTEEMHRPLAQVNFGASDLAAAAYSIKTDNTMLTGVTLTGIHSEMSVLTGNVTSTAEDVTFAQAPRVPAETPQFVGGYDRVAMVYALVDKENQANVKATLNVTAKGAKNDDNHTITREIANVPLKRNYRTNILGNIFTNDFNFTVNTVPGFATPEINETLQTSIAKANDLFAAGQTSVTVDLAPDADGIITLPATTEDVRLNLNITTDKTITIQYASGAKPAHVEIYAKDVENIVAELTSSTVIITSGSHIHTGTFATAASTLIIEATAKVDNLIVNAGSTKIYGEVGTISGDAADKAAYYIATVDELKAFRDLVNGGKTYEKVKVVLENDLDLSSVTNWTPIGTPSAPFKGQFDGNGKTISHLTIDNTADNIPQALFGYLVGYGASFRAMVKNLTVDGADIKAQNDHGTAVVVGSAGGYTTVSEVTVKNATLLANRKVGGVANGYIQVLNCHAENVSVTAIPNEKDATYDNGDKVGAIVGFHGEGSIEVIGNTADNVTVRAYRDLGGIIGIAHTDNIIKNNTVTNSTIIRDAFTNKYADESKNAGKVIGRRGSSLTEEGNVAGDDVKVIGLFADGIEEDEEGILHILSKTGLESFRDLVNASDGNAIFSGRTVVLDTDIDLNKEDWTPIGNKADSRSFVGIFDGQDHVISNLSVNVTGACSGGLFGADDGCTIKNLVIDGAEIHTLTSHSASGCAVILGANQNVATTIEKVTVKNAKVYGNRRVAGIAGYFKGSIINCVVEDVEIVASVDELSGAGKYDNGDKTGGIIGYANGDCTITGNSVENFSITGYRHIGGVAGYIANSANVKNNTVKNGTLIAFSEHIDVDNHTIGDGTSEIIGKASVADDTNTFENVRMIINGEETLNCSISDDYKLYKAGGVQFSAEEFEDMSGKIIYEKGGKFMLTSKTVAQLTAAIAADATLTLYMVKGNSYIIQSGRSSGDVTVNIIGLNDYEGNKMAAVNMVNPNDADTGSYRSYHLNLTVKNLILIGNSNDANGDDAGGKNASGFCYAKSLVVEDCTFTKSQCIWVENNSTVLIKSCLFDCTGIGAIYPLWTRGTGSYTLENCVFNEDGKALKVYATTGSVTVTGCTFNRVNYTADKFCVEVDSNATVTVSGCTNNGHKGMATSRTNVTVLP